MAHLGDPRHLRPGGLGPGPAAVALRQPGVAGRGTRRNRHGDAGDQPGGPANDFANLWQRRISFRVGALITGVVGVVIQTWRLMEDSSGYIFKWLIAYSALLGAVGGVLIADYFLVCRTRLDLQAWGGSCWYTGGFHAAGLLAPAGEGHPLRAGVPGHRRTGRGDAILDGPVPLCLVSRFRDDPPGILGPDAPAPGGAALPRGA